MALASVKRVAPLIGQGDGAFHQTIDQTADQLQGWVHEAVERGGAPGRGLKDLLHGTWLGHPLHSALSDVPIGAWWTGALLDLLGYERAADGALGIGVLAAVPTAAAGLTDWSDTQDEPRRLGLVHGLLNAIALVCFISSWLARRRGDRETGVGLSVTGLALTTAAAFLGGELVYRQGTGVNRNAWNPETDEWRVAAKAESLKDGELTGGEITVQGRKQPLVLLKRGDEILALSGVCSHWGGPLAEGKLIGHDCVECPWHGSQFSLRDGAARRRWISLATRRGSARETSRHASCRQRRDGGPAHWPH